MRIIVYHRGYGCETGCCGHVVETVEGDEPKRIGGYGDGFEFAHPYGSSPREFAEKMVAEHYGAEHVKDLDWDNCLISDD